MIKDLKRHDIEKDKRIALCECLVEQFSRMNDLTVSGLETRLRLYARVAAAEVEGSLHPTSPCICRYGDGVQTYIKSTNDIIAYS